MNPFRRISIAFGALATAAFLAVASHSVQAQRYDFQWYSGAAQTWVYEAAPKLLLDVYDDPSTPEEDVYFRICLLYTSPSPRDGLLSRMPSSA